METTITMTGQEQRRAWVLTQVLKGDRSMAEAAELLGVSERQVWRLRTAFVRDGPAGLVHGNRGRVSGRRIDGALRERIVALARERYVGCNDSHLAELLAEREAIIVSRASVRRMLRAAGIPSKRRRRPPAHRSRRERMPAEGTLLQLDGSRHDWLAGRGPWLTLVGAIDDATGKVPAATFRDQEDAVGYLEILQHTVRQHGIPLAVYRDRHGIFAPVRPARHEPALPSQVGRALAELGSRSIAARSPQAKGRIERLWGTFQDRLVAELRLAGVVDRNGANAYLPGFLARHNARFAVSAADSEPDWQPVPPGISLDRVFVLKYRRKVAKDHTIRLGGAVLSLPRARFAYSGKVVEVHVRLDGSLVAYDGERELAVTPAPADPAQLRTHDAHRVVPSTTPGPATLPSLPSPDHPWRRVRRGTRLYDVRLTESLTS